MCTPEGELGVIGWGEKERRLQGGWIWVMKGLRRGWEKREVTGWGGKIGSKQRMREKQGDGRGREE